MKLIQLDITLSDNLGNICGIWKLNFSNFDLNEDPHME